MSHILDVLKQSSHDSMWLCFLHPQNQTTAHTSFVHSLSSRHLGTDIKKKKWINCFILIKYTVECLNFSTNGLICELKDSYMSQITFNKRIYFRVFITPQPLQLGKVIFWQVHIFFNQYFSKFLLEHQVIICWKYLSNMIHIW